MVPFLIKNASIRSVRVSDKTVWRHLIVQTEEHVGYGEYTLESAGPQLDAEAEAAARVLVGCDANSDFSEKLSTLRRRDLQGAAVVSAVDQAIQDLRARLSGAPLAEHLAGSEVARSILLYANINRRTVDRSPVGFKESAELALGQEFAAIKIAPFDGMRPALGGTREGAALVRQAVERIASVRDVLPKSVSIMVDCHWRLTRTVSLEILPELAALGVSWFECPLPEDPGTVGEIAEVRRRANRLGIRLAGCETMTLWEGFRPFVEADAYDVLMPDVKYVGGFAALRDVVERAERHGVAVSMHNPTGPICHLQSLHASAALGLTERLEVQFEESPLFASLVDPAPPPWRGGASPLPLGDGLGAALLDAPAIDLEPHPP